MESIAEVLGRFPQQEPDEMQLIKRFIAEQFQSASSVTIQGETLVVTVSSAALATTLRLRTLQLQAFCKTTKRLVFRIG